MLAVHHKRHSHKEQALAILLCFQGSILQRCMGCTLIILYVIIINLSNSRIYLERVSQETGKLLALGTCFEWIL